jgi:hypothetical protein
VLLLHLQLDLLPQASGLDEDLVELAEDVLSSAGVSALPDPSPIQPVKIVHRKFVVKLIKSTL